ncbi:hypothetical protein A3F02_00140 [Candidatus Curtissbacteria bacterium RIFCSPHIGHO2_12_FULL_38_9b]|uniref:Uncharacterized protein n=2 Tax=Candidatus Curtissiibacteriota TaxID=1752717 RepID=A0A1F5GX34_9BACT|nr:MAG: hypothetical protein A3A48_03090 [Candidatus Curtissbacteria bacterium RIFCSPLOWO2_01_FULL_37_9]OGD96480.1 MAG: hypothetical protein A3F02_00140 [Candidatus Curtissbacteria bacterium RIFCSPHIGHO2_12_FULL_38_9b]
MIERGFGLLRRLPPKAEVTVGAVGTTIYAVMSVAPAEVQDVYGEIPISGWLINLLSVADLRMSAGALVIVFGAVAFDGFKKLLAERHSDANNQGQ